MERVKKIESVAFVAITLVLFVFSALPFATASQSDVISVQDNLAYGQGDIVPTIVHTIPAPEPERKTQGLAWDGTYIWCGKLRTSPAPNTIYKLHPSNGSEILNFTAQGIVKGLTWDGTNLWQLDASYPNATICKLNPLNGSVISSFPADAPKGLAYGDEYLWYGTYGALSETYDKSVIHKVDPSDGTDVATFDAPEDITYGLAWDGTYLWCAGSSDKIYKIDPDDGSVVSSFNFTISFSGLTWDGTYLWVSQKDRIDQVDTAPSELPVQNIDTGKSYSTIQAAINDSATEDGHTIRADAGTYHENVVVNKSISLIGADRNTTIIEGGGLGDVINVTKSDVKISDFNITGTDYDSSVGILTGANTTIDNCTVTNSRYAIKFGADNCTVKNTLLIDNLYGIFASEKTNQEIYGNQILNSYQGICLMTGNGTEIYDNVIQNSTAPLAESDIPTGIYLSDTGDLIYNNSFINNTRQAFVFENRSNTWNTSTVGNFWSDYTGTGYYVIDENNTDYLPRGLGGASIQELINTASPGDTITVPPGTYNENVAVNKTVTLIGTGVEVIGLNPFNVTEAGVKISDFNITGTNYDSSVGILTGANTTIDNCTITNCGKAIKFGADNCTVKNTLLTDNLYGIYASKKTNQEIYGNQILNSYQGICLMTGNGTEIYDNVIQNSTAPLAESDIPTGIYLSDTGDLIYNNSFINNTRQAFVFENRSNTWNTSTVGNFWSDYTGTGYYVIDENNTDYLPRGLGGASIQELINTASPGDTITVPPGTYNENVAVNKTVALIGTGVEVIGLNPFNVTEAGVKISDFNITGTNYDSSVGILTGANTTIDNCTITNCGKAIKFGADNCTVKNTLLTDNLYGIYASKKTNQEIYGNQILNSYQGICLMTGNGTEIYDNVIQNSTAPLESYTPTGIYLSDTGDLIYNNSFINNTRQVFVFENRSNTWNTSTVGNFWSDYTGTGYYVIDENNTDYLPIGMSVGFDTGEGTYPSISGTHNGTITLTQTIKVNWMYTYPCEGTGGHSEYVAFFNVTTGDEIANGTWNGYAAGNYSNITFDEFELTGGVTYRYEIRTGSYPQILHQDYLQNSMGNITCSEFTDLNGVEYDNWIPAIRLG